MKTSEVAKRLSVSAATIRQWTQRGGPYREFMSGSAKGENSRNRVFTEQDVRILTAANELSRQNMGRADIITILHEWQANDWPDLPSVPPLPGYDTDVPMMTVEAAGMAVQKTQEVLNQQIVVLEREVRTLEKQLDRATGERQALELQLRETQGELGELRGKLTVIEATAKSERQLYRWAIVAVAVAAAVLLAIVLLLALQGGAV